MAPAALASSALSQVTRSFEKRQNCYQSMYGNMQCYNTGWYNWGRWVLLGLIVLFFFLTLLCLSRASRRRRARGNRPMYGTGWMSQGPLAPPPYSVQQPAPTYQQYDQGGNNYAPQKPAPAFTGANPGYEMNNYGSSYGNNNNNYGGNDYGHNQYAPPAGAPPQQGGIIR